MTEPKQVFDAEVVRTTEVSDDSRSGDSLPDPRPIEHVDVRRVNGRTVVGRTFFQMTGDPDAARVRLREVKFKLWLWLCGLGLVTGMCLYGAFTTEVVIYAAFLLIAAVVCGLAVSFIWLLIWALRRLPTP